MKTGKSITELAIELERVRESQKDLIVPTAKMVMEPHPEDSHPVISLEDGQHFNPTNWAHSQISTYSNVPKGYYDRIKLENASLLSSNVNHGFQMAINASLAKRHGKHDSRMLRTVDGNIRGFLSDRYRRLDCYDLMETTMPVLIDNRFKVESSEFTERRMYLKAVTDRIQGEVKKGHVVQYGLAISSSDVGCGSVRVEPLLYELVCDNGMIMSHSLRKFHIGKSQSENDITELLTDETKEMTDKAFWHQVRDVILGTMKDDIFQQNLNKLREAAEVKITNFDIPKVVELSMKEVGVSGDKHKESMVQYLANGADGRGLNKWALANAFTWAAQAEDADYDEATDLERAGAKIIELPRNKWEKVAA